MTDRTAQARDAYWNTHPHTNGPALDVDTLRFGVEWADANHPAVEALARVRKLHTPFWYSDGEGGFCEECTKGEWVVVWPCATHQATEVDG